MTAASCGKRYSYSQTYTENVIDSSLKACGELFSTLRETSRREKTQKANMRETGRPGDGCGSSKLPPRHIFIYNQ